MIDVAFEGDLRFRYRIKRELRDHVRQAFWSHVRRRSEGWNDSGNSKIGLLSGVNLIVVGQNTAPSKSHSLDPTTPFTTSSCFHVHLCVLVQHHLLLRVAVRSPPLCLHPSASPRLDALPWSLELCRFHASQQLHLQVSTPTICRSPLTQSEAM